MFASLLVLSIGFFACKQLEDEPNQEPEEVFDIEEPDGPIYDPYLGAHTVAPELTKVLQNRNGIAMYELTMEPGDTLPWHEHPPHTFYILEEGTLTVIFENGSQKTSFYSLD